MVSISSHLQICQRAYEIFQERLQTGGKGDALSDWLEAEQEIRRRGIPVQPSTLHLYPTPTTIPLRRFSPHPRPNPSASRGRSAVAHPGAR